MARPNKRTRDKRAAAGRQAERNAIVCGRSEARIVVGGEHFMHIGEGCFSDSADEQRAYGEGGRGAERWDGRSPRDARDMTKRAPGGYLSGKA